MEASSSVGCARRWEEVKRFGGILDGGMSRRSVVEVPREIIASPRVESETVEAGLSPVKGAMAHSAESFQ